MRIRVNPRGATTMILLGINLLHFPVRAEGQTTLPTFPRLGLYADLPNAICGKKGVELNPKELPWIGCFALSNGNSSSRTIAGRNLEIAVNSEGQETFKVDGATVVRVGQQDTNVPNVKQGSSGLIFCTGERDCPTDLSVISRNSDKSVTFGFAQRFERNSFVTNQENWDYEQSRQKIFVRELACNVGPDEQSKRR
jgi:hypothetical protein